MAKQQTVSGIKFDTSAGEKVVDLGEGLMVGRVLVSRVHPRRNNYRQMNQQQLAGLKASIARLGFKSLVTVNVEEDGTFGIIDGHHRYAEAVEAGDATIPVVFLFLNKLDADWGMLSFNISAETLAHEFNSLLKDIMAQGADMVELSAVSSVSVEYLDMLNKVGEDIEGALNAGVNPEELLVSPRKPKSKKRYIVIVDWDRKQLVKGVLTVPSEFVVSRSVQDAAELQGLAVTEPAAIDLEQEKEVLEVVLQYTAVHD